MIAFVAISTLVNIGLGYALAVYLNRSSNRPVPVGLGDRADFAGHRPSTASAADAYSETAELPQPNDAIEPSASATSLSAAPRVSADSSDRNTDHLGDVGAGRTEKELLAGIEEFRHHLSRLKGAALPTEAPARDPANSPE